MTKGILECFILVYREINRYFRRTGTEYDGPSIAYFLNFIKLELIRQSNDKSLGKAEMF